MPSNISTCIDCGKTCRGKRCRKCHLASLNPSKFQPCIDCGNLCQGERCRKCYYEWLRSPEERLKRREIMLAAHAQGIYAHIYKPKIEKHCVDCGKICAGERCRKCYYKWVKLPENMQRRAKSISDAHKRGCYTHYQSEEHRQKLSVAAKTRFADPEYRQRWFESINTPELRKQTSDRMKARWVNGVYSTEEYRQNLKAALNRPEVRAKISESHRGEKNPAWRGGASFEPYGIEFDETLRREIRERDGYKCAICGGSGNCVHHIDYNKRNNDPSNLITLCRKDHSKTTGNREYWQAYFTGIDYEVMLGAC